MRILTAGDNRHGTDTMGRIESDGATFREMIAASKAQAERFGYDITIYDLGDLGLGEPFAVEDASFRAHGYYRQIAGTYFSKALHKPDLVAACIARYQDFTVYLDGDAVLWKPLDDVVGDYDVAVTIRDPGELRMIDRFHKSIAAPLGLINAGVIFFRPSEALRSFLAMWKEQTELLGSDQLALNHLLQPDDPAAVGTTVDRAGVRVRYLPAAIYNFYNFQTGLPGSYRDRPLPDTVRIMHFKGSVRRFFRVYFPER